MTEPRRESERASREMARAAEEISKAAGEWRRILELMRNYEQHLHALEAMAPLEDVLRQRSILRPAPELPEEEVALIADQSVHRVRKVLALERADQPKAPAPTADEIREWDMRREERRKREAS